MSAVAENILVRLNEAKSNSKYGGYVSREDFTEILCQEMFHHTLWEEKYFYVKGVAGSGHYMKYANAPKDEKDKIRKTADNMEKRGIIKFSKSRMMILPLMTVEEYKNI